MTQTQTQTFIEIAHYSCPFEWALTTVLSDLRSYQIEITFEDGFSRLIQSENDYFDFAGRSDISFYSFGHFVSVSIDETGEGDVFSPIFKEENGVFIWYPGAIWCITPERFYAYSIVRGIDPSDYIHEGCIPSWAQEKYGCF